MSQNKSKQRACWTEDDNDKLIEGIKKFGKDYNKLAIHLGSAKSNKQVARRIHSILEAFRSRPGCMTKFKDIIPELVRQLPRGKRSKQK